MKEKYAHNVIKKRDVQAANQKSRHDSVQRLSDDQ